MMPLALSAALSFSMVLRPQVHVHRCHASPAVASRYAPVLAQFGDFLKKGKAADGGESDEPVEYLFDPANAEEDDPDPSPPMAEEAAEPAFDASSADADASSAADDAKAQASQAAADAAGQASEAARGALASVQGVIAEAAAKAVSAVQEAAQEKLDEIAAVPTRLASAAEEAANQAVAEVRAVHSIVEQCASPAPPQNPPGDTGGHDTPGGGGHGAPNHCRAGSSEPPRKSQIPTAFGHQVPTKVADAVQAKAEQLRDDASVVVQQKVNDLKAAPGNALLDAKAAVDEQQDIAKSKVDPHGQNLVVLLVPRYAWPPRADSPALGCATHSGRAAEASQGPVGACGAAVRPGRSRRFQHAQVEQAKRERDAARRR